VKCIAPTLSFKRGSFLLIHHRRLVKVEVVKVSVTVKMLVD